jgi:MerR HTH family regulatory protein
MPDNEKQGKSRTYLTVAEVARRFTVTPAAVHRWEKLGHLTVHRTEGGHRRYDPKEVERFAIEKKAKEEVKLSPELRGKACWDAISQALLFYGCVLCIKNDRIAVDTNLVIGPKQEPQETFDIL